MVVDKHSRPPSGQTPSDPADRPPRLDDSSARPGPDRLPPISPPEPPYLPTAATNGDGTGVTVIGDAGTAVIELRAQGSWSSHLAEQVTTQLRLRLAGPSTVIIVDLQYLDDPHAASLPFWLATWRQARLAPAPAHMVLCLPPTTELSRRLRNLQGPQPRVCDTTTDARIAIAERASSGPTGSRPT